MSRLVSLMNAVWGIATLLIVSSCSNSDMKDLFYEKSLLACDSIEAASAKGVTINDVFRKNGWLVFSLSDNTSFSLWESLTPCVQIGLDGYWYKNGIRSEYLWGECDGAMVAGNHCGESETSLRIRCAVEGFTDWTFFFDNGQPLTLIKTLYAYDYDSVLRGINHRGFNTSAPENTLPAFRASRLNGFKYVETDIRFTADGIPVCIHDDTVNRTSDGSGSVKDLTLAQLYKYDFGSWKDPLFIGTRIPTFVEFLSLCNEIGLFPYIELKEGTEKQIAEVVALVDQFGLREESVYISFSVNLLKYVLVNDSSASVGYLTNHVNSTVLNVVGSIAKLAKDASQVFIDSSVFSEETVAMCKSAGIPLEIWTIDSSKTILFLSSYITGVTSNRLHAGRLKAGYLF